MRPESENGSGLAAFAPAVFLGAFLVFQIQPLVGKHILPWFGGAASVWTTCLLVFQSLLFAGYALAHLLTRLDRRAQAGLHVALLVAASAITVLPADTWKPSGTENPLLRIVAMLLATTGLPYLALAATGPLLQAWFWRAAPGRSPYPLYALSNAGSLLGLLTYPFVLEPWLTVRAQAQLWRGGFVLLVALVAWCAARVWRAAERPDAPAVGTAPSGGSGGHPLTWIAWSACGVILLMAITNQMTLNLASIPFLWVLPLSLYLLTFIVAFGGLFDRRRLPVAIPLTALVVLYGLLQLEVTFSTLISLSILQQILLYSGALAVLCLFAHAELHRTRPAPRRLTTFYLCIAGGGALGGLIVGAVGPVALLWYQELHLGMLGCCAMLLIGRTARPRAQALGAVGFLVLVGLLVHQGWKLVDGTIETRRSFFGFLRVTEWGEKHVDTHGFKLYDGSTLHGYQFSRDEYSDMPTMYYSRRTGVGHVLELYRVERGRRIGVVGLGIGTVAAYGLPGDAFRFYEVNPDVAELATTHFSFLAQSRAGWEIILGDARLRLENEPSQSFDVLILDAFSSESIPVHLLTSEAFDVYDRHLQRNGVVAVNISNKHLDLSGVVHRHAVGRGWRSVQLSNPTIGERATLASTWMILSRDEPFLEALRARVRELDDDGAVVATSLLPTARPGAPEWTDDYSSLFHVLK